jgi:hypothetical protein
LFAETATTATVDDCVSTDKGVLFSLDMKLQEIEQEALGLSERERAELVLSLMSTLVAPETNISDEEVVRRDAELETGSVEPMLHEEFVRRVREERGR